MSNLNFLLLLGICLVPLITVKADNNVLTCYYGSWSVYRPGLGQFDVDNIDPFLCTHFIFGFAGVNNQTWEIEVLDPWNEDCASEDPPGNNCAYDKFVAMKDTNPDLVITLGCGGWNEGSMDFSNMAKDDTRRATFVSSTVTLLNYHMFDGLDVDWEYPTQRGGIPEDKENYIRLLKDLREAFDSNSRPLVLTTAVAAGKDKIDPSYDVPAMIPYLDRIHLMTYDFHGSWETTTNHNAPLCGSPVDEGELIYYRVDYAVDYWISLGAPKEMLIMGVAVYGRCYTLQDSTTNGINAPASGAGPAGPYTRIAGTLGNNEICERLTKTDTADSTCTVAQDPDMYEPYFYCTSDKIWCGYDDVDSAYMKGRYAKNHGLGGALVWEIDQADFIPECGTTRFPSIDAVKRAVNLVADTDPFECPNKVPIP